ncbi:MAG: RNA-binding S4 domain-containing protein [Actinomycetota bacterium]|nr:RNA-binding S4 domain-containing protein [Actinomycetota bacterium]
MIPVVRDVQIRGEMIRLGQLLQYAGIADSGGAAKQLLADGAVTVNGRPETRRGRQLHPGDVVAAGEEQVALR